MEVHHQQYQVILQTRGSILVRPELIFIWILPPLTVKVAEHQWSKRSKKVRFFKIFQAGGLVQGVAASNG